jgi:hypothetical protein
MANILEVLKEELLVEGKSWENFYESLPNNVKEKLLERTDKPVNIVKMLKHLDPTSTESNAGKYSRWIITNHFGYSIEPLIGIYIRTGPIEKTPIYETLEKFEKIKKNLHIKDINQYKNIEDIEEAFEKYESKKSTKKLKGKLDAQEGKWGIKKVDTAKESCELGKGTKWCITNKERFDDYNKKNNIYFLADDKKKYAVVVSIDGNNVEVYNEQDKKIGGLDLLKDAVPEKILKFMGLG